MSAGALKGFDSEKKGCWLFGKYREGFGDRLSSQVPVHGVLPQLMACVFP